METIRQGIRPEKAIELFKKNGIAINPEEAEAVLELLYLLAEIFMNDRSEA